MALGTAQCTLFAMLVGGVSLMNLFTSAVGQGVPIAVVALLAWGTLARRDLWPFSHYPMFAGRSDADAVRYFRLRFELPNGEMVPLTGHATTLADAFHRELEAAWSENPRREIDLPGTVGRYWREACRLYPRLADAHQAEITICVAHIIDGQKILLGEQRLETIPLPSGSPA